MIKSSSFPFARLHKRHNILSFHFVRSMVAAGFIAMQHIPSKANLADVVSKHWAYNTVWKLLNPVFHHMGNTANLYIDDDMDCLDRLFDEFFIPGQPLQDGEY